MRPLPTARLCAAVTLTLAIVLSCSATASAAPAPAWEIVSVAHPTNFSIQDNATCNLPSFALCDQYLLLITNVGGAAADLPVTITDTLPPGLSVHRLRGANLETQPELNTQGAGWSCSPESVSCTYSDEVKPGATLVVAVEVEVSAPAARVRNAATVSGGGAPPASTSEPLSLPNATDGRAGVFAFAGFGFTPYDERGRLDLQAADHPQSLTTTVMVSSAIETGPEGEHSFEPVEPIRDIAVELPVGFLGDPAAAGKCTERELSSRPVNSQTECPPGSRLGMVTVLSERGVISSLEPEAESVTTAVYNMVPEAGYPAELAFKVFGKVVPLYASLIRTPAGYAVRVAAPGVPRSINVQGTQLTLFGDPDVADGQPNSSRAFFTNPDDCASGPLTARVQADSWAHPGVWLHPLETVAYPRITGCNLLQFEPQVALEPETTQSEAPSGETITIRVPQTPAQFPVLATPDLKDVTMTLPEGMTISPGGGSGLAGCQESGPQGIDIPSGEHSPSEAGEGEVIGPDGMSHLTAGHCPAASQIGKVVIHTPVLEGALEGHMYIAAPKCGGPGQPECTTADATNGNLFGLYLEADGSGVVVKLKGTVSVDPSTGRVTARFTENPQLPVSEVSIRLKGGARAPLANPRQCGPASANADLTPWSSPVTPDALISSPAYQVDWDGRAGRCPATVPFAPTLEAGPTSAAAGRFAPFTFTVRRGDRQQDIARVQERMPAGLLGMLKNVAQCGEPQAAAGSCPEASRIGTVNVAAGSGSQPLWVQGRVYLTGPYAGAPFGLSIVVPAVAGPFNLGNVIVRSRIDVDPSTSALTVTSDPLPQFRDGVPLRIQTLNITIDRPGFTFNPTDCSGKEISASVEAEQGASANVSAPFAVEGCKSLPFKPSFKVSTQGKASKASGASLSVSVSSKGGPQAGGGEANIRSVRVELPKQLPARLTTLQKACVAKVFEANPALCPKESDVGSAKAVTPVLAHPLVGPAYLVSHGGAAFPDLEVVLQGEGIVLVLDGQTNIKRGITSSDFAMVPDAPVSSFSLTLPQGKFSALTSDVPAKAKFSLCGQTLKMPTTITGQNGVVVKQSTKIGVTGCAKAKKKASKAKKAARRR